MGHIFANIHAYMHIIWILNLLLGNSFKWVPLLMPTDLFLKEVKVINVSTLSLSLSLLLWENRHLHYYNLSRSPHLDTPPQALHWSPPCTAQRCSSRRWWSSGCRSSLGCTLSGSIAQQQLSLASLHDNWDWFWNKLANCCCLAAHCKMLAHGIIHHGGCTEIVCRNLQWAVRV